MCTKRPSLPFISRRCSRYTTQRTNNATVDPKSIFTTHGKDKQIVNRKTRQDAILTHSSPDLLRFFCSISTLSSPPLLYAAVRVVVMVMVMTVVMVVVMTAVMVDRDASDCSIVSECASFKVEM